MLSNTQPGQRKASEYIRMAYTEQGKDHAALQERLREIHDEMQTTGSFTLRSEELTYGAKVAWRNSNRCIGRVFWKSLHVFDHRELQHEADVFEALLQHIDFSTNSGTIRSCISIFDPKVKIWNAHLIRYAGFRSSRGIIGDPDSVALTDQLLKLGWNPEPAPFRVMPLIIQIADRYPCWFEIPAEHILEVPITHPEYSFLAEWAIKWYALPAIANMILEVGGQYFPTAPFSGWYMGTEIGARNLADENRFNLLPKMAKAMQLDTSAPSTLWKDRALVELNRAVLHSFEQAGVRMLDHHTASELFRQFHRIEEKQGRSVTGDWSWLIPPVSPATTHVFHQEYDNTWRSPNYWYRQQEPWE